MKLRTILTALVLTLFLSCDDDIKDPASKTGDLYVTVLNNNDYYSSLVEGATVFTDPPTEQGLTDEYGTTLLKGLDNGSYEVYAEVAGFGSAKTVVNVRADSLEKVQLVIIKGVTSGFTPELDVILPSIPANFSLNEEIVFSLTVTDQDSPSEEIAVTISSSIDGELTRTNPDELKNVKYTTSDLSRGIHTITIEVVDGDGYKTIETFELSTLAPGQIELLKAEKTTGTVVLEWSKYEMSDFRRYELYRSNTKDEVGQVIKSFSDVSVTSFIDDLPPLESEVYYYLRVINIDDQFRYSNRIKVDEPAGKIFYGSPIDAVHHPSKPILYVVDESSSTIKAINYEANTVENTLLYQGTIGRIAVGDNGFGLEIYVPNSTGFIHVYNANTFDLVKSISTGLSTACVVTNGKGYLVASVHPSPWWEQPVRTYSRETGINISGNGDFEGDFLRFIPDEDKVVSISTQVSPVDMEFFDLNESGSILKHYDDQYHGDHPLDPRIFRVSVNGEYVVTSNQGAVYSATSSMLYKGIIDRGTLRFSDFAFSSDASIIYAGTSNRNSIQIVKYPELTRQDEILIKGYPKYMFNHENQIISISTVEEGSNNYAIERINIE